MQFGLRPKSHGLGRRQAVQFALRPKTHGLNGCDPCWEEHDKGGIAIGKIVPGEWVKQGVGGVDWLV